MWNLNTNVQGDPYRAFAYIPLCTGAAGNQCTEPFVLSFSVKYLPPDTTTTLPPTTPLFDGVRDYLKLLFWSDGNNILGVKKGQLLGVPNDGAGDLVGSSQSPPPFRSFSAPFVANTWYDIAVRMNVRQADNKVDCSFTVNGLVPAGHQTATVGLGSTSNGIQFGAYLWGNSFFKLQYKNIQITASSAVTTPASTTTQAPPAATTAAPPSTVTTTTASVQTTTVAPPPPTGDGTTTVAPGSNFPTSIPTTGTFIVPITYMSALSSPAVINVDILSQTDNVWYGKASVTVQKTTTPTTVQITLTIQTALPSTKTFYLHGFIVDAAKYTADPSMAYQFAIAQTQNIPVSTSANGTPTNAPPSGTTAAPGTITTPAPGKPTPTRVVNAATSAAASSFVLLALMVSSFVMQLLA